MTGHTVALCVAVALSQSRNPSPRIFGLILKSGYSTYLRSVCFGIEGFVLRLRSLTIRLWTSTVRVHQSQSVTLSEIRSLIQTCVHTFTALYSLTVLHGLSTSLPLYVVI